ncbi:hypothetical protein PBI_TEAMOCIL_30 [Microbacterium phage Teamocil]|uniref:Uncharacterized protein n=1 Tax=Microbacterium phage Teamocil TaxID=2656554 RepID=A0A649VXP5_9CAUD|nr:hypothetical protein QDA12_gp30 [Microbacterium phage Teamocil]QGJ88884.1 hypothetical protein PBI_GINA_30 [Microbacterium phage Gina]QGJ96981.1 hypothetical protein PBI_TEAMOCIL_30 [Microbacterium phage Teamocil]
MSDPTNTDGATVNTDAQTTSDAGGFEYPDGSTPEVGPDGLPILEDRSADFPVEAAEATEVVAEPVIETRDGRRHRLGTGSGLVGYRGLAAKRAEKAAEREEPTAPVAPDTDEERQAALAAAAEKGYTEADLIDSDGNPLDVAGIYRSLQVEGEGEQGQESGQEAPEGSGTDDDTSEDENGPENDDQGSSDGEESDGDEDDEPEDDGTPADEGYDPSAHTVTEVTAYLDEHPDQATYVLDRERTGKARVTLIGA